VLKDVYNARNVIGTNSNAKPRKKRGFGREGSVGDTQSAYSGVQTARTGNEDEGVIEAYTLE